MRRTWPPSVRYNSPPWTRSDAHGAVAQPTSFGKTIGLRKFPPDQTGPYETRLLESAERLNQRILAIQRSAPADLALNDKPAE